MDRRLKIWRTAWNLYGEAVDGKTATCWRYCWTEREHERKCPWRRWESSPVVQQSDHLDSPRSASSPLDQSEERKLRAGCDWWRGRGPGLTSLHAGSVAVEHVVVCSDWRDLVPNLLNITSIRFGQVSYRPASPAYIRANYRLQNCSVNYSVMSSSLIFVITHILSTQPLWPDNLTCMLES